MIATIKGWAHFTDIWIMLESYKKEGIIDLGDFDICNHIDKNKAQLKEAQKIYKALKLAEYQISRHVALQMIDKVAKQTKEGVRLFPCSSMDMIRKEVESTVDTMFQKGFYGITPEMVLVATKDSLLEEGHSMTTLIIIAEARMILARNPEGFSNEKIV